MWAAVPLQACHGSQQEPAVVLCASHNQRCTGESGQWMKGISCPPGFKWFVQNRKATMYCRTYGAAQMATNSVGTGWFVC